MNTRACYTSNRQGAEVTAAPTGTGVVAVLIPAYNPDGTLVDLVRALQAHGMAVVVVVDDGSAPTSADAFRLLATIAGCTVLRHASNLGKGNALKTGLRYLHERSPGLLGVVTADADGQHLPADIARLAQRLSERPHELILGVRRFEGDVPLRSALGNNATRVLFAAVVGRSFTDTQTGLRGIPSGLIPKLLQVAGERYEYEMNVLVACRTLGIPVSELPISTVYLDGNRSSHFRPLWDSMSIYAVLFRFVVSSLVASAADFALFAAALGMGRSPLLALVLSRTLSSIFYLALKKDLVFRVRDTTHMARIITRYYALAASMAALSYALIQIAAAAGLRDVLLAKAVVELMLFWISFVAQRDFVFHVAPARNQAA